MNTSSKIFNSFQEYIEAENMVFQTLDAKIKSMTLGSKDIE
jgi:50S ribosomal subunit-associated GTPase HflX